MLMWRQAADVTGRNEDVSYVTEDVREAVREDGYIEFFRTVLDNI